MTAPQLVAGQVIAGKYAIRGLLQHGGLTATYHASGAARREVALKTYDPSLKGSVDLLSMLRRHEVATNALPGNWAVHILETGEDPGCIFSASEFSINPSLAQLMDVRPLSPPEAVTLLRNLARVIDLAHSAKLAHLGLKPTNLFVGSAPSYEVRVADFGLHGIRAGRQTADPIVSWLGWIAPEQLNGPGGAAADVFSAALVTFFAMTGRSYWRASQRGAVDPAAWDVERRSPRTPVSARAAEFSATIPPAFDAPFLRALADGPGERFTSVGAFAESLAATLEGRSTAPATLPRRIESLNATVRFGGTARNPPGRSALLKSTLIGIPMPNNPGATEPGAVATPAARDLPQPDAALSLPGQPGISAPRPSDRDVTLAEAARAALAQAGSGGTSVKRTDVEPPPATPVRAGAATIGTAFTQPAPIRMGPAPQVGTGVGGVTGTVAMSPAQAAAAQAAAAQAAAAQAVAAQAAAAQAAAETAAARQQYGAAGRGAPQPPARPVTYGIPQDLDFARGPTAPQPDPRERASIAQRYAVQEGPLATTISVAQGARGLLPSNPGLPGHAPSTGGAQQVSYVGSGMPVETMPSAASPAGGSVPRGGTVAFVDATHANEASEAIGQAAPSPRSLSPLASIVAEAASEAAGVADSSAQAPLVAAPLPIEPVQLPVVVVRPARRRWIIPVVIGAVIGIGAFALLFRFLSVRNTPAASSIAGAPSTSAVSEPAASVEPSKPEPAVASSPSALPSPPPADSVAPSPSSVAPAGSAAPEQPAAAETATGEPPAQAEEPAARRPAQDERAHESPSIVPPAVRTAAPPAAQPPTPPQTTPPAAAQKKCGKFLKRCQ